MRFLRLSCWFLMVEMFFPQSKAMAQDLKVLVLDALDGTTQANVKVDYFCTRPQYNSAHKRALTNNEGLAQVSNPCRDEEQIEISIYPPSKKEQCGVGPITLKDIVSLGVVAKPDAAGGICVLPK
jgi:hypothetical protein